MKQTEVPVQKVKSEFSTETIIAKSHNKELLEGLRKHILSNTKFLWVCIFTRGAGEYTLTVNNDSYGKLSDAKKDIVLKLSNEFLQGHDGEYERPVLDDQISSTPVSSEEKTKTIRDSDV